MKRLLLICTAFLFPGVTYGQAFNGHYSWRLIGDSSSWHFKGQLKDGSVKAYLFSPPGYTHSKFFVYKRNDYIDTLLFSDNSYTDYPDTILLRAIQVDGKGLKEILVTWNLQYTDTSGGKTTKGQLRFNEIWNLDTHEKIFSAQSKFYQHRIDTITVEGSTNNFHVIETFGAYSYDFKVNKKGQITIKNLQRNFQPVNCCQIDNEEGIYDFINGRYILRK